MSPRLMIIGTLVAPLLAACGAGPSPDGFVASAAIPADLPTYNYALSGGDKLRVIVFDNPNLGGDYAISGAGSIALPLIGEIEARGLTSTQLQQRIAARLADGYLKEPRVAVEVLSTRPYYILGEVNKPGEYPYANGLTVAAAVAQAGGYSYRAKTGRVLVQHAGATAAAAVAVQAGTPVAPGDIIRVPERWF